MENRKTIIQIGAHTGNDHVTEYVTKNTYDLLVLVEANTECIELLSKNYESLSNVLIINKAVICGEDKKITLYLPSDDNVSQHSSGSSEHLSRHGHQEIRSIEVDSININDLLSIHGNPERLYIDVEGYDLDLVNEIDFTKFNPNYLCFEYIHSDGPLSYGGPKLDKCLENLNKLGYITSKEGYNVVATLHSDSK